MSNRFVPPVFQQVNSSGDVFPGSKLEFFRSGTTIKKTIFADQNLSVPLTNPVVSDAAGVFPDIFLDGSAHRVVFRDQNDVQLNVFDPVFGTILEDTTAISINTETQTATEGQTLFTLTSFSYNTGANTLNVFVNGVNQISGLSYIETSSTTITFVEGLEAGDIVFFSNAVTSSVAANTTVATTEIQTATASQTVFTLTTIEYLPGANALAVYINGVYQPAGVAYTETNSTTVTFTSPLDAGDQVTFLVLTPGTTTTDADTVTLEDSAGLYDALEVEGALAELRTDPVVVENTGAQIYSGAGSPEGVVSAAVGSLFLRTDGGAGTTLWVKESGAGPTGWVSK